MADLKDFISGDPKRDALFTSLMPDSTSEFCYSEIAPRLGVSKRDGKIGIISRDDKITDTSSRSDDTAAKSIDDLSIVQQPYNCESLDRRKFVSNAELKHNLYNPEIIKAAYSRKVADTINRLREKKLADLIQNASNYDSSNKATLSGTDQFTHASSKPIDLLVTKAGLLYKATGIMPDSLFLPWVSWQAIITNANVKAELAMDRYQTISVNDILPMLKTGAFAGLTNIVIGRAVYDTGAKKDKATVSRDYLWSDSAIIFKKAQPIQDSGLVEVGFVCSVESDDPEDLGYYEYEDTVQKLKGMFIEQRYSHSILNCSSNTTYYNNAYLIADTNG